MKYFSISSEILPYYLTIPIALQSQIENKQNDEGQPPTMHQNKRQSVAEIALVLVKARPGRLTTSSRKFTFTCFSKNPSRKWAWYL